MLLKWDIGVSILRKVILMRLKLEKQFLNVEYQEKNYLLRQKYGLITMVMKIVKNQWKNH